MRLTLALADGFGKYNIAVMKPTDGNFAGGVTPGLFNRYYGLTTYGGLDSNADSGTGDGTLFYFVPSDTDPKYKVLWRFGGPGDGVNPTNANLAVDSQGRLYGVTAYGGANNLGTVFMLQYVDGGWQEQVIYSFQASTTLDLPTANVVLDAKGNLYGCAQGGTHNQGGLFRLTPPAQAGAAWSETVLYNFGDQLHDPVGSYPDQSDEVGSGCGIALNQATNLIVGTRYAGGFYSHGTIYTLTPPAAGQTAWTETVGYSFRNSSAGGDYPSTAPLQVGNTYYGGAGPEATIYAFTP
jgi:hypothetical protein